MTEAELTQLFVILDQVWGGLDEDKEAGYRYVLARHPAWAVAQVVEELAQEDRPFLPRPPEIAARAAKLARNRQYVERITSNVIELEARRERGELSG